MDARTEAEDADLSLTEFLRDRDAVLWDPLILAMLDPCKCSFLLGSNWEASEVEPSGAWNAEAAFDDPMCFISGKVDELWQLVREGHVSSITAPANFCESPFGHSLRKPMAQLQSN